MRQEQAKKITLLAVDGSESSSPPLPVKIDKASTCFTERIKTK
jgi:hypothetical protein